MRGVFVIVLDVCLFVHFYISPF